VRTRAWPAGTTRRGLLLFDLASVAALIMLQSLALRAGVVPEVSWRPALAGTALVWVIAIIGYLLPGRRRIRPVPETLGPVLAGLTSAAGVTRAPRFAVDPRALGAGAVTLGRRGRYLIVLDAGLVHRAGADRLTAVVLHELAHVRNGDVELARLMVAVWRTVGVIVLLPFTVVSVVAGDTRDVWLGAGTAVVLYLLYADALRRRELYADRDAVANGADPGQWAVPAAIRLSMLRTHPTPAARRRALGDAGSSAASSMVGDSFLGLLLTGGALLMLAVLADRPALRPGMPAEWPHQLTAVAGYGSLVIALAALLTPPSERFRVPGAQYVPLAVRQRRSAAIRLSVVFGLVAALLFGFDPGHLVAGDLPERAPVPGARIPPPPAWETPRSAALSRQVRAWITAVGGPDTLSRVNRDREAMTSRLRATPARRIDWAGFAGGCSALDRDAAALDAGGPFPVAVGEVARVRLQGELRATTAVLCGRHSYTSREFRPLSDAGAHLARANDAAWTLRQAEFHYLISG